MLMRKNVNNDVSKDSPLLPVAPCYPSCQNFANQCKPETTANVNKHVKGKFPTDLPSSRQQDTPRKACLGRKPKAKNPNDYRRCYAVSFKVRYRDLWKSISPENLFLKGLEGTML